MHANGMHTLKHSCTDTCKGQLVLPILTLHIVADVSRGVARGLQRSHMQTAHLKTEQSLRKSLGLQ